MARSRATDSTALVRAAAEVFNRKGYRNTTIDDIADAAGISRPTVYKYTDSKQALLDSVVDFVLTTISTRLDEALGSDRPAAERLRDVIDVHVHTVAEMRTFYAILFSEEVELSDHARDRFADFTHEVARDFQHLLDECLEAGATADGVDTHIAGNLVLSMLTTLYRWYDPTGPVSPAQLTDQIQLVLGALTPR